MLGAVMTNWSVGWWLILMAFVTGAILGLFFHDEKFMGGYDSFRRRLARLGHISLAALGMLNVLFAVSTPVVSTWPQITRSLGIDCWWNQHANCLFLDRLEAWCQFRTCSLFQSRR